MAKVAAEVGSTANSYQILGKLAVGGMAEIFLARGAGVAGVERYCVLKRILHEHASDAQFVQMFLDEARLAAQLQHPNIAQVYDIGMLGDSYFFTMEYVHGETVRSLLSLAQELGRPLPLACVLTIIAGTAAGLHHAHERNGNDGRPLGIVHRDVTPSNVMVSYEGNVKVVDFGVAKAADREVQTKAGTVKGKISYLSPEQCRGARVDRRSDLFSLGIVMWEMLTCTRLYRRNTDFESMTAIVHEPPPPPSSRRPDVPRAVDDIVLRLLAKSVTDRFQTAADVVEAIENASARAGTILSTSAVSRLIRDLFGIRAEPWLVLDGDTQQHQPITLGAKPIPQQPAPAEGDSVEIELAGVPDLSSSSISTGSEDDAPKLPGTAAPAERAAETDPELPPASTMERSPRGPVGSVAPGDAVRPPQRSPTFGLASMVTPMTMRSLPPPPRAATSLPVRRAPDARAPAAVSAAPPERPVAPIPVRVQQPAPPMPDPAAPPGRGSQPAIPTAPSLLSAALPIASVAPPSHAAIPSPSPSTGSDRIAAPVTRATPLPRVAPPAQGRLPNASPLHGSPAIPEHRGPSARQSSDDPSVPGSPPITAGMESPPAATALPTSTRHSPEAAGGAPPPPRTSQRKARSSDARRAMTLPRMRRGRASRSNRWLIGFCGLAGGIGVAAVLLWMRMQNEGSTDRAITPPAEDTRRVEDAGVRQPSAEAVRPDAATALESLDANDAAERSEIAAHDAAEATASGAGASSADAGAADQVMASPAVHRHHRRSRPSPAPPAASDPGAPPVAAEGANLEPSPTPSDPARSAADTARPQPSPAAENPALGPLNDLFHLEQYAAVVDHCSQTDVTSEIANVCVLAACYIQASDKAKIWLSKLPGDQQRRMASRCAQIGGRASAASGSGAGTGDGSAGE